MLLVIGDNTGPEMASVSALSHVPRLSHPFISVAGFGEWLQDKHLAGELSILRSFTAE